MSFASVDFIIFLGAFFIGWPWLKQHNLTRWTYLTAASLVFYGWWDWRFLILILISGLIDFYAALAINHLPRWRKGWLVLSISGNLGILIAFKYLDFIIASISQISALSGLNLSIKPLGWILPVGISFYTFQSMSYTIDVYRGRLKPTHNILHFFAFLSMFPQLVAGPIIRASDMLDQLRFIPHTNEPMRFAGFQLIVLGYFKKMAIANSIAPIVNNAFEHPYYSNGWYWWAMALLFAVQIYCDFSGYSDIARGLAKWMGYEYKLNFDHPYLSSSFQEFWTRWHISLSNWFRDYVYIPMGGNRGSAQRTFRNLWITMILSGLWHGAAWTFLAWGAAHALLLSVEKLTEWPDRIKQWPGGSLLATMIVFLLTLVTWILFRAENLAQAAQIISTMFHLNPFASSPTLITIPGQVWFVALLAGAGHLRSRYQPLLNHLASQRIPTATRQNNLITWGRVVMTGVLIFACILLRGPGSSFIYFQF